MRSLDHESHDVRVPDRLAVEQCWCRLALRQFPQQLRRKLSRTRNHLEIIYLATFGDGCTDNCLVRLPVARVHCGGEAVDVWLTGRQAGFQLCVFGWGFLQGALGTSTLDANRQHAGEGDIDLADRIASVMNGLGHLRWQHLLCEHLAAATVLCVDGRAIGVNSTTRVFREDPGSTAVSRRSDGSFAN